MEEPGLASPVQCMSGKDLIAYEAVVQSMKRSEKLLSKYQVRMPWKNDTSEVPCDGEAAEKRLECTEVSTKTKP